MHSLFINNFTMCFQPNIHCTCKIVFAGNTYNLFTDGTNNNSNGTMSIVEQTYVSFRVRACAEVHLIMTSDRQQFEVVLGAAGNTQILIREHVGSDPVVSLSKEHVVSCSDMWRFWVSWDNSNIRVGSGTPLSHEYLSWRAGYEIYIKSVTFSTALNHWAEWDILHDYGRLAKSKTVFYFYCLKSDLPP